MSQADDMVDEDKKPSSPKMSMSTTMAKSVAKTGGKILIFLSAFLAVCFGAIYIYIQQAGGLTRLVERSLSSEEWGINTQIEEVTLHLNLESWSIDALVSQIEVQFDAQQVTFPELAFRISPASLYSGAIFSTMIEGVSIELVQENDGVLLAGDWGKIKRKIETLSSGEGASTDRLISALASRNLILKQGLITVRKQGSDEAEIVENLNLNLAVDQGGNVQFSGSAAVKNYADNKLAFEGHSNIITALSEVQIKASAMPSKALSPFLPELLSPLGELGELEGDVSLLLDSYSVQSASGFLGANNGYLPLSLSNDRKAAFSNLQTAFSYSRADDYLVLSETQLKLPDGRKMSYGGEVVGLHKDITAFNGSLLIEDLPSETLLTEWPQNALPEVRSYLIESFQGGAFDTLALIFDGQFNKAQKRLSLSSLSLNGELDNVRVQTGYGQYKELVGTAKGRISVDVGNGGILNSARLKLAVRDGYVIIDNRDKAISFENASGEVIYQKGQLLVPDLRFDFGNQQSLATTITIGLDEVGEPQSAQVAMSAPKLDVDIIQALWPQNIVPRTAGFLKNNLKGGELSDFDLSLSAGFEMVDERPLPKLLSLETELDMAKTSFVWMKDQRPLNNISGHISLSDNVLSILIEQGENDAISLEQAEIYINPVLQPVSNKRLLTIKTTANAPMDEVVSILDAPQINRIESLPVDVRGATGTMRASIHLAGAITQNGKLDLQLVKADGAIEKGAIDNVFRDFDISDADLVISATPDELELTGAANLSNVPGHFNLKNTSSNLQITGHLASSPLVTEMLAQHSGQEITGALGGRFTIDKPADKDELDLFVAIDLSQAGVNLPILNWAKIPSETGQASAVFHYKGGYLKQVDKISIDAGSLSTKGSIFMDDKGQLEEAVLADVKWPGNHLDAIVIKPDNETGSLFVQGDGDLLDLRSMRRGEGLSEGLHITFDLTANRLLVDQDIDLYGRMTGEVQKDGNGKATLQGALIVGDKPLLEQGTVTALFGPDGEYLNAVGLIGGAEARLEYSPEEADNPLLFITSQNAGRVLSGLGITDTIRAGRLVLVSEFVGDGFGDYNTTINLEEFNVIEAPAAVRAFSVLGLAGLYSLVEGDGTRFTRGEAYIETRGKSHNIKTMKASGGAVGLTMLGSYNSETKQVDVSGNLVPVNQFSKIIGAVPVLGELLSGVDKSGIFATQFNVTGEIADPETSVNAASIAPGFLRDLFSPNWLARERNRILGEDNQTAE